MKKLLSLVLVLTVVLSSMSFAFAAVDPTVVSGGIDNSDVKSAVERLSGLGLVAGMEDGKYHPELKVTREQAAKLIVEALGLGAAAEAAKGATPFADVAADRWSSGYVNVAVGQGIIKGMGDGTFAPASEVTYAQVITMVVRALGYSDDFLKGVWPGNYVAKAAALSLTKKVTFAPAGTADRGSVAVMINNALDTNVIKQTTYGDQNNWQVSVNTLLEDKLQVTKSAKVRVTAVPRTSDSLKANEITYAGGVTKKVLQTGLDLNSLLNKEIYAYLNSDGDVAYVSVETAASDVVVGMISSIDNDADQKIKIKANGTETEYSYADQVGGNGTAPTFSGSLNNSVVGNNDVAVDMYGTFVKDSNGKIAYADVYSFTTSPKMVKSVDVANKTMRAYAPGASTDTKVTLKDNVKVFGAVSKLEDIKANDVVYVKDVPEISSDDYSYIFVARNVVTGKLEKANTAGDEITIAGKKYNVDNALATVSLDNGTKIEALLGLADVKDAITKDVTAYLDIKGEVRYLVANTTSSSLIYGVLRNVYENEQIRVYIPATDTTATYSYDNGDYTNLKAQWDAANADIVNMPIVLTLDSDGALDKLFIVANPGLGNTINGDAATMDALKADYNVTAALTLDNAGGSNDDLNSDYDYIMDNNTRYYVTSSTVFVDASDASPAVVKWDDIKEKALPAAGGATEITAYMVTDADGNVAYVAFTNNYNDLSSDFEIAVVTDRFVDDEQRAIVSIDGVETTKQLENTATSIEKGDIIFYSENADGNIDYVARAVYGNVFASVVADVSVNGTNTNYDVITGTVKSFGSDRVLTLDTTLPAVVTTTGPATVKYKIASDVEVWLLTYDGASTDSIEKATAGDIAADAEVSIIVDDENKPVMVIVKESV